MKPDTGRKSQFLPTNLPIWCPPLGGFLSNIAITLNVENQNGVATQWWKNLEDMFIRFDRIQVRDGQMDEQTDGHADRHCMIA